MVNTLYDSPRMELNKPHIISLPKIIDVRGNLSVLEHPGGLPFDPVRAYWMHDAPGGATRPGHAFYTTRQLLVALSGSIDIITDTGSKAQQWSLTQADKALYVPELTWCEVERFSTNAVLLVVASTLFDRTDYIDSREALYQLIEDNNG